MYGLIPQRKFKVTDYHFGGISGIAGEPLNPSGQWDDYLPEDEVQYGNKVDSMACVTFSALNNLEILFKKQYELSYNFSDRYIAKLSDTTPNGNYLYKVADTIRKYGLVKEEEWPFDHENATWDTFYADVPPPLIAEGENLLSRTQIQYEFVSPDNLRLALSEAPLQVTITVGSENAFTGIVARVEGPEQHAVTLYGYEDGVYWKMYDHYLKIKKKLAWDYKFFTALKYNLSYVKPMAIPSNTLIQLIDPPGNFGLLVGDKLYVDDLAKITASWLIRNNGKVDGKVKAVKQVDWSSWKQFDLKNNPLN